VSDLISELLRTTDNYRKKMKLKHGYSAKIMEELATHKKTTDKTYLKEAS
jgi:hypothetical protein